VWAHSRREGFLRSKDETAIDTVLTRLGVTESLRRRPLARHSAGWRNWPALAVPARTIVVAPRAMLTAAHGTVNTARTAEATVEGL